MADSDVAVRLQRQTPQTQALVLLDIACSRNESGRAAAADINTLFDELALPRPSRIDNTLTALERRGLAARAKGRGAVWRPTPVGRAELRSMFSGTDVAQLLADASTPSALVYADTVHPVIPATLAPPALVRPVAQFLDEHPFERKVFGMTRFPSEADVDPVADALDATRDACVQHGLEFHLANGRAIVDDLWANVAAHMWASKFGVAFFEDRAGRGINLNLAIEVGSMMMAGRRVCLLRDETVEEMPTDLVGRLYKPVDLGRPSTVKRRVHEWLSADLGFDRCNACPR